MHRKIKIQTLLRNSTRNTNTTNHIIHKSPMHPTDCKVRAQSTGMSKRIEATLFRFSLRKHPGDK